MKMRVDCLEREISYYLGHYQLYNRDYESRDTFTSRISPLFFVGFEFTEKRILSPPFHVSGMEDVGSRNPLGLLIFPTTTFDCVTGSLYFLAMASFVSPPLMCQRRRVILGGGSTWVAIVTVPLNIQRIRVSSR